MRSRAAAGVLAGDVTVAGRPARKPGELVDDDTDLEVAAAPPFVSRGGIKLANALDAFGIDLVGRRALDVGASTGGFTDCLLQRGASSVIALDVAYGELNWRLRNDARVTVIERRNARSLEPEELPYAPDLIVADVSFISLAKVLPAVLACAAPVFDCLAMVKPQFEVGRERVGKGGVVRSDDDRRAALVAVGERMRSAPGRRSATRRRGCPDRPATGELRLVAEAGRAVRFRTWRPRQEGGAVRTVRRRSLCSPTRGSPTRAALSCAFWSWRLRPAWSRTCRRGGGKARARAARGRGDRGRPRGQGGRRDRLGGDGTILSTLRRYAARGCPCSPSTSGRSASSPRSSRGSWRRASGTRWGASST